MLWLIAETAGKTSPGIVEYTDSLSKTPNSAVFSPLLGSFTPEHPLPFSSVEAILVFQHLLLFIRPNCPSYIAFHLVPLIVPDLKPKL